MTTPVPRALVSRNPLQWLRVFGPGAIIASLTIGTGELIFSSRGGVIFGYAILFPFLLVCILKWTLAYSAARHMVLSGAHPFQRWMDLPVGPRGWLTLLFFVLAAAFIPVWVSFHASVLGDLLAGLTGTKRHLGGATIHLWGAGLLIAIVAFALAGGYAALEKTQIVIVALMLVAVIITLLLFGPEWLEMLRGFVVPQRLEYPEWLTSDARQTAQQIAARPVWVELSLYAGVIGGASYDYLAYASFLRDKEWGNAASAASHGDSTETIQRPPLDDRTLRLWIRAPLIDCTLSFLVVLLFSAVFVASGKLILGPAQQIPGDGAFLEHQAQFVTHIHPWLYPLYVIGVFLAMLGTLYGTLEVAPTVLRETMLALGGNRLARTDSLRLRVLAIGWCGGVALLVLAASFIYQLRVGEEKPPGLTAILIPVNLFTGVFACGLICLLNPWMDRSLAVQHRMPRALVALNLIGACGFIFVALRGYWDYAGWGAMAILAGILALGIAVAWLADLRNGDTARDD
ncbi:MAG: Nramp family divalent metal transporter [Pirellulales bacterium]